MRVAVITISSESPVDFAADGCCEASWAEAERCVRKERNAMHA
jgi:hypothetical protein